eukprot:760221-Hanusia_phi.AAC.1
MTRTVSATREEQKETANRRLDESGGARPGTVRSAGPGPIRRMIPGSRIMPGPGSDRIPDPGRASWHGKRMAVTFNGCNGVTVLHIRGDE